MNNQAVSVQGSNQQQSGVKKSMLFFEGEIVGVVVKEYQGTKTYRYQFLQDNGDNGLELINIKLTHERYLGKSKGETVKLPVVLTVVEGNLYYKTVD